MKQLYWSSTHGNFGDDMNEWFWDHFLPGWKTWVTDHTLVGIGTILNRSLLPSKRSLLIVGSGVGYGNIPVLTDYGKCDIRCVRGRISAELLGIDKHLAVIDPAVMVSQMQEFHNVPKNKNIIFIPHFSSVINTKICWDKVCKNIGIDFVSPLNHSKDVIRTIASAKLVIAESMHAAIIADSFRVPWISVRAHQAFNICKWYDWADSLDLDIELHDLYSGSIEYHTKDVYSSYIAHHQNNFKKHQRVSVADYLRKYQTIIKISRYIKKIKYQKQLTSNLQRIINAKPNLSNKFLLSQKIVDLSGIFQNICTDFGAIHHEKQ